MIGEAWLSKKSSSETNFNPQEIFDRDTYSFFQPLDIEFHQALVKLGHYKNFSLIAPFWSRYYFAYLDYDDPEIKGQNLTQLANQAAFAALSQSLQSDTGRKFSELIKSGPPPPQTNLTRFRKLVEDGGRVAWYKGIPPSTYRFRSIDQAIA